MNVARGGFISSVALALLVLCGACLVSNHAALAIVPLACAGPWFLCLVPRVRRLSGPCFAAVLVVSSAGLVVGLSLAAMLAGVLFSLAAWDLEEIAWRCRGAADTVRAKNMALAHLVRLLVVVGAGAVLAAAGLLLRVSLSFPVVLGTAALLMASLGILVRGLARWERAGG